VRDRIDKGASMSTVAIPTRAYQIRTVNVPFMLTNVQIDYVPALFERPKAANAIARARLATAFGDLERTRQASIDYLSEVLVGWSHKGSKPTREALARQPMEWLGAAVMALSKDMQVFARELEAE
jgi:hypothetical protein